MKILILTNSAFGFKKFRSEFVDELLKENEVYLSLPFDGEVEELHKKGCKIVETIIDRRGINPIRDLHLVFNYFKLVNKIKPDIVLTYTIKPNIFGGIVCSILKTPYITNITGLGTAIENKGVVQRIVLMLYKISLRKAACVFFQNKANMSYFSSKNITKGRVKLIPGSGVNLEKYKFEEYPRDKGTIKFLFIGRIMRAKGADELLEAAKRVKEKYTNIEFHIIGIDEENYLPKIRALQDKGIIYFHGKREDVRPYIIESHAIILPSYHEGISNVLLEAASTGRPILASKVPGCIETFDDTITGYGFEVKNVDSLVKAIIRFIETPYNQKEKMGKGGRGKMEEEFDRRIVTREYMKEIEKIYK